MILARRLGVAGALAGSVLAAAFAGSLLGSPADAQRLEPPRSSAPDPLPLAGVRIALDPGHQLGNRRQQGRTNRLVHAGGFAKPCNTTGTETASGYPEATFTFQMSKTIAARLRALGAEVHLTRNVNSDAVSGPCVDERGRFGAKVRADLAVSLHADGAPTSGHGFHVIAPRARHPWTTDIATDSWRLAKALRAGLLARGVPVSTYAGFSGLARRGDLGTLNLSDVPIVLLELGNMRNPGDARRMESPASRSSYATAVVWGIRKYLDR